MIREYDKKIILEDGAEFYGFGFGDDSEKIVEMVFNTSMVGYQEILSDPSYTGQAVVMTYPLIGNYGICTDDYETKVPTISALIVREYNEQPSNFRAEETLEQVMQHHGIAGIAGVDTRRLARHIRDKGTCSRDHLSEPFLCGRPGKSCRNRSGSNPYQPAGSNRGRSVLRK